jgi:hypothetical protein
MHRGLTSFVLLAAAGWFTWVWWDATSECSVADVAVMAIVGVGAVAGVALDPRRHLIGHLAVACGLLASWTVLGVIRVADHWPFVWDAMPSRAYAGLITAICGCTIAGLVRGAVWARWMAMAFAATVTLCGTLNAIGMQLPHGDVGCEVATGALGGLVLWIHLACAIVRERFTRVQPLWLSHDRLVRSSRWAAIAACIAAPMLVLYALCQPVVAATVIPAYVLAPVLALGAALVVARRTAGVMVLAVAGAAMVVELAVTLLVARGEPEPALGIAAYYACFWLPIAVMGPVAGAIAVRRAR